MLAPKKGDTTQRHQLFRTRCTINGNICDLIIDSGSQENIIGKSIVEKLQLSIEKHPSPYSIGWIKTVGNIQVTEHCKVPFSVGKYKDEVYCDVVDMDACHLLFGRPWQFDKNAHHFGRENIYKLETNGVRMTLLPLNKTTEPKASKVEGKFFLTLTHSEKEFEAACRDTQVVHCLVVKEVLFTAKNRWRHNFRRISDRCLKTFKDIMPEELPAELSPMRDIQHHIDLIPGASLPNLPYYRMSPRENEILLEKVEELFQKGHI